MTGAVVVVGTGRYATGGLLTWSAWQALQAADQVLLSAGVGEHWQVALTDAGLTPEAVPAGAGATGTARRLLDAAEAGSRLAWFAGPDGDPALMRALTEDLLRRGAGAGPLPEFELVLGSWDEPGAAFLDLVEVLDRLRSPGGCPWDAEQTHASLLPYLLEESYELIEAVESGDRDHVVEELGDVLMQVVFHARVGQEGQEPFDIDEVAAGISAKLIRRHPHVFADGDATTPEQVEARWHEIKAEEKGRAAVLDGIPVAMPALPRAAKIQTRLERAGLPTDLAAARPAQEGSTSLDLGIELWDLIRRCRAHGVDPEAALREANTLAQHRLSPGDGA